MENKTLALAFTFAVILNLVLRYFRYFFLKIVDRIVSTDAHQRWFYDNEEMWNNSIYNPSIKQHKRQIFAKLAEHLEYIQGSVVELGVGCGGNFEFMPKGCSLIAIEPNLTAETLYKEKLKSFPDIHLKQFIRAHGESMTGLEDRSVAAVVCTNCLCSIRNLRPVLLEIKRVLKPGGRFFFLEHCRAKPYTWIYMLQYLVMASGVWERVYYGCSVNSEPWKAIEKAGFKSVVYERFLADLPVPWYSYSIVEIPHVKGYAQV